MMLVFGKNESRFLRNGWHEREIDARVNFPYRSTLQKAELLIDVEPETRLIYILLAAPTMLLGGKQTGKVSIVQDDKNLMSKFVERHHDRWSLETIETTQEIRGQVTLEIESDQTGVPDRVLHNGDMREFGWMISAVWQRDHHPA